MADIGDVVVGTLSAFRDALKLRLADLTDEQVVERAALGVNPIGFTVWHAIRGLDLMLGQLNGQGADGEVWNSSTFAEVTKYNPRGKGFRGLGTGTGYTRQLVDEAPATNRYLLLAYVDAVVPAIIREVRALGPDGLLQPVTNTQNPLGPPITAAQRILALIDHGYRHLGETDVLATLHGVEDQTTPRE